MRFATRAALLVGALGSAALTGYAGRHNAHIALTVIFVGWVVLPFAALALARRRSATWPAAVQRALGGLAIVTALISLGVYTVVALHPPRLLAFPFLITPLAEWLIIVIVIPAVAVRASLTTSGR